VADGLDLRTRVAEYVAAVNGRDAAAIADQFSEDAVQADPVSNPANVGRQAIRSFFESGIAASDDWRFEATRIHTCGEHVAVDFRITVSTGGQAMVIEGIEVFATGDDGRFTSAHAYWDEHDVRIDAAT
jgi:ketosteroid isomerase-like protein